MSEPEVISALFMSCIGKHEREFQNACGHQRVMPLVSIPINELPCPTGFHSQSSLVFSMGDFNWKTGSRHALGQRVDMPELLYESQHQANFLQIFWIFSM